MGKKIYMLVSLLRLFDSFEMVIYLYLVIDWAV